VGTAVEFTEDRYADTKRELMRLQSKVESTVEKVRFAELSLDVKAMRKSFEEEMDAIQKFAREARDKQTEMAIKFAGLNREFESLKEEGGSPAKVAGSGLKPGMMRMASRMPGPGAEYQLADPGDHATPPSGKLSPRKAKTAFLPGASFPATSWSHAELPMIPGSRPGEIAISSM
jgi:hypothetical protein